MAKSVSRFLGWERFLGDNFQSRSPEFKVGQSVLRAGELQRGKVGLMASKSVSRFLWGKRVRHDRRDFYTARGVLPPQIAPLLCDKNYFDAGCTRDPPRVWASTTDFFEEKGSGVLNPTPNYRSRPLPLRLKTILAQESTETCGQRHPKNQALRGPLLRRTQRPAWSCHT